MARAFPPSLASSATPAKVATDPLQPATNPKPDLNIGSEFDGVSVEACLAAVRAGDCWHNNMLLLVGHWISRGWSDEEILTTAEALTLPGWTTDQTRREVATMISGGRTKWNIPNPEHGIEDRPAALPLVPRILDALKRFKRWVTHEVLPTIRKTGAYVSDAAAASDPILTQAQMLIEMRLKQIAQEQRLSAIEQRIEALPAPTTHLSVLAFANLNGIRLDNRLASVLGKHCAALTRLHGGVIGAVADDHYGTVGNYPLPVLRQVFAAAGLIPDEHLN